ncbi:insulin-like growth factor-binding protein 4 [Chiloscyllium plagiosum]|uniref:insulin-like growth factor-binding protein 4 n=1 Tax=Chiloscyllium plagiosum TaxID=36176 RepID=UPI001CB80ED1|nr:insulin-like growth factor-binding protein 4 [Chiloscyllium plagiosum]
MESSPYIVNRSTATFIHRMWAQVFPHKQSHVFEYPDSSLARAQIHRQLLVNSCVPDSFCSLPSTELEDYWELEHPDSSHIPCHSYDKKCIAKHYARIREKTHNNGRSKNNHIRDEPRIMGPCHGQLQRALERFAMSLSQTHENLYHIPIPNCDRKGFYHPKQCHPSLDGERGKCWCVEPKTGVKLIGSPEVKGDIDCQQFLLEQEKD